MLKLVTTAERVVSEERKGVGAKPGHALVVFEVVDHGLKYYCECPDGGTFTARAKKLFGAEPEYVSFAVNMDRNLRFHFTERFDHMSPGREFYLDCTLSYRVASPSILVSKLASDPIKRVRDEVATVLGAKAAATPWETILDSKLQNNFVTLSPRICGYVETAHLRTVASELGIDLVSLNLGLNLTTEEVVAQKAMVEEQRLANVELIRTQAKIRTDQAVSKIRKGEVTNTFDEELHNITTENAVLKERHRLEIQKQINENSLAALKLAGDVQAKGMHALGQALLQIAEDIRSPEQLMRASELAARTLQFSLNSSPADQALLFNSLAPETMGSLPAPRLMLAGANNELVNEVTAAVSVVASIPDELDRKIFLSLALHWLAEQLLGRKANAEVVETYRRELAGIGTKLRSGVTDEVLVYLRRVLDDQSFSQRLA